MQCLLSERYLNTDSGKCSYLGVLTWFLRERAILHETASLNIYCVIDMPAAYTKLLIDIENFPNSGYL